MIYLLMGYPNGSMGLRKGSIESMTSLDIKGRIKDSLYQNKPQRLRLAVSLLISVGGNEGGNKIRNRK